ncbi:MAG TPA: DUF4403 family protein [Puia sp.]|jgi:hypothetical protein|nr:DUF4403 family protein [Puia sp.]
MKHLVYLPVLMFLLSCSSAKKLGSSTEEQQILPELPISELDIPIKIAAAPILAKAEKLVPSEFTSDAWPDFLHPSCDFRYKYRFVRTSLSISCANNLINIRFGGNYQVSGSKCLCTAGIPVTPWISGNCGFLPQPLRKVNMALSTNLQFLPNYQVRTTTIINQIQPVDKCSVSVFSNDITRLVMDSIRSSLASFSLEMDQTIAGLNFEKFITQLKDSSYRKIVIGKYGYFLLNPSAVRIGQMNYLKDSFSISMGISCRPQFSSDPVNHIQEPTFLPALLQTENRNGIRLYLNLNYDYNFLTNILRDSLHNKVFEVKGRTIVVKDAIVHGIGNQQMELRIDFAGSNHGSIYLRGTPVLDTAKQTLDLADIQYSLEGEDLALKIGRSLFRNKIRKTIQGKSYLDIEALLNSNKTMINQFLNREWTQGIQSIGSLKEAKIIGMLVTRQNIQLQIFIAGELKLLGGNL